MPIRAVRKYSVGELSQWFQVSKVYVDSGEHPKDALPWKYVRVVAMHHKHDRRNTEDAVWLDKHVRLHAKEAGGLPAVSPGAVPVAELVERFKRGDAPQAIARALSLDAAAVASAIRWAQKTAASKAAWTSKPIALTTAKAAAEADPHGKALVEAVIAWARGRSWKPAGARTLDKIDSLRLADGRALPPSLVTWLSFDASKIVCGRSLKATTLAGVIASLGERFTLPGLENRLPGPTYLLDVGDRQATFLYADSADEGGEYPILTLDVDGQPEVTLSAPGFDVYIAVMTGFFEAPEVLGEVPKAYQSRLRDQAKRLFGGQTVLS